MSGIFRVKKDARFFAASNEPFNDKRLSWEARGVMGYLLSKPDGWELSEENLLKEGPAGEHKIRRIVAELKTCGYVRRTRVRQENGLFDWVTEVYESPSLNPDSLQETTKQTTKGLTTTGSSTTGSSTRGKPPHIVNTEAVNTEAVNTEETAADTRASTGRSSDGNDTAAAGTATLTVLGQINGEVRANPRLGQPLTALESIASRLEARGETETSIRAAWETCQANGRSPVGAFLSWCQQGFLPVASSSRHPRPEASHRPLERTVNGQLERWIGNSWVRTSRRNSP